MLKRSIETFVTTSLSISPIVLLKGSRQVGKSTLSTHLKLHYVVLDDISIRLSVKEDPIRFIQRLSKPACIDEIEKAPELLEALKLYVDANRRNGDFLLTGSANILDMKQAKDTLAGRIIELELYPLSLKEKSLDPKANCIDNLFEHTFNVKPVTYSTIVEQMIRGGYPEVRNLTTSMQRRLWFSSYISTYVERDARDLGELRDIDSYFRFLNIVAPRSTQMLVKSDLAKEVGVRVETIENYLGILEQTFQVKLLRPYFENIGKQFVKSPKLYMNDTGLMNYFLKIATPENFEDSMYKGAIVETLVCNELMKHLSFTEIPTDIYHYRTNDKKEIDFILKRNDKIIAIEVKASMAVSKDDFKHIADFQKNSSKDVFGVVFYMGEHVLSFGEMRVAIPIGFFF
ncbi:MAG: ATP-binding protein [Sulfuricurvum sp.]|nr:ATP-binding protein [Sulfuricurvum sp.]MDD5387450.1 ATP-binding protein [Sulfuricurvum sp.]